MPSLKTIRKRIASVKSTQKITKAMKMVAGARLARAQADITAFRPMAVETKSVINAVTARARTEAVKDEGGVIEPIHPLLEKREEKKVLCIVLSSDRGLCGAFNSSIARLTMAEWQRREKEEGQEIVFATMGRKVRDLLRRRGATILRDFETIQGSNLDALNHFATWVMNRYRAGEVDAVYLVYNEFKSAITQKVVAEKLLPLPDPDLAGPEPQEYIFEPNKDAVLNVLVPRYVMVTLARAILESRASELGARMSAMDSATRNASQLIGRLTLQYNRARQASITKELMEIIGGAEALKD